VTLAYRGVGTWPLIHASMACQEVHLGSEHHLVSEFPATERRKEHGALVGIDWKDVLVSAVAREGQIALPINSN